VTCSAEKGGPDERHLPPRACRPDAHRERRRRPAASAATAGPSDWTFELLDQYHAVIRATAQRFGLDTYPNQLEIITAEQMMDAYASVGMPVNYRHWSYGKEFMAPRRTTGAARWAWLTKSSSTRTPASAT
jgi:stage V sporulation protein R